MIVESIQGDRARLERRIADAGYRLIDPIGPNQGIALLSHPEFALCADSMAALSMVHTLKKSLEGASRYFGTVVGTFEFGRILKSTMMERKRKRPSRRSLMGLVLG